jgi:hypothetical protein
VLGEILQIAGAILILSGFLLTQFRGLSTSSYRYLILNLVGAGILAELAAGSHQWGFLLLEFTWSLAAAVALIRKLAGRHRPAASDRGVPRPPGH